MQRNDLNCLNRVKVVNWVTTCIKKWHMPESTKRPPNALSITETNKNQYRKDGLNQPVLPLPCLPHPLPSSVTRGLWAHLLADNYQWVCHGYFCMPCEPWLTAIWDSVFLRAMCRHAYWPSFKIWVPKLWVPLLQCISLCVQMSLGPLCIVFGKVQGTSIRKCQWSCYYYCYCR